VGGGKTTCWCVPQSRRLLAGASPAVAKKEWRYPRWRRWALAGFFVFLILAAVGIVYSPTEDTLKSASDEFDFHRLIARGDDARNRGWYPEALNYYRQALVISREVGHRADEGMALNSIGGVYHDQGLYGQALENYQQALVIAREVGDRAGEGRTLNNIGLVYDGQGLYEQALESFEQALVIVREVGDRAGEGATLNNIGLVYRLQGLYEQALENYQQALVIARDLGLQELERTILDSIERLPDN
jgi:tetratricopeptide (TPR) repeat protein